MIFALSCLVLLLSRRRRRRRRWQRRRWRARPPSQGRARLPMSREERPSFHTLQWPLLNFPFFFFFPFLYGNIIISQQKVCSFLSKAMIYCLWKGIWDATAHNCSSTCRAVPCRAVPCRRTWRTRVEPETECWFVSSLLLSGWILSYSQI